jgi:hypothetical protein
MTNVTRLEFLNCSKCELSLKLVRRGAGDGVSVRYDVQGWARQCQQACGGSPLACPWVTANMRAWLTELAG